MNDVDPTSFFFGLTDFHCYSYALFLKLNRNKYQYINRFLQYCIDKLIETMATIRKNMGINHPAIFRYMWLDRKNIEASSIKKHKH